MKKKSIVFIVVALLLALALIIGGISAYFTDSESKTNTFTIGNVSISLTEPAWTNAITSPATRPEAATNMTPGDSVAKDPTVTVDTGSEDAFIFVKVEIPNYPNSATTPVNTDLFTPYYMNGTTKTAGVKSGWNLVTDEVASNKHTYVYAYATGTEKANLQAVSATNSVTLFDGVTLSTDNKVVNDANTDNNLDIVVTAYGIQADNITEATQLAIYQLF